MSVYICYVRKERKQNPTKVLLERMLFWRRFCASHRMKAEEPVWTSVLKSKLFFPSKQKEQRITDIVQQSIKSFNWFSMSQVEYKKHRPLLEKIITLWKQRTHAAILFSFRKLDKPISVIKATPVYLKRTKNSLAVSSFQRIKRFRNLTFFALFGSFFFLGFGLSLPQIIKDITSRTLNQESATEKRQEPS